MYRHMIRNDNDTGRYIDLCVYCVFVIKDFNFNPFASPFLPTTGLPTLSHNRLTETSPMATQLPYVQPGWSNHAEFPQSHWSNIYQPEPSLPYHLYDSTVCYGTEEMGPRNAVGFDQPGNASYPVDWYSDSTGNFQAFQSLPSLQVIFCFMWLLTNI